MLIRVVYVEYEGGKIGVSLREKWVYRIFLRGFDLKRRKDKEK